MSPIQRQKASDAYFKALAHASQPTLVTSTDGLLTVPTTPGAGKKLNQKRRRHAENTPTHRKHRRLSSISEISDSE